MAIHREWKVEKAPDRDQLQVVLNGMTRAGWEVFSVMVESSDNKLARFARFTIVLYRAMVETRS